MIIKLLFNTTETMLKDRGLEAEGKVQKIVDSEVLRRSDPYVPFDTGYLKKSGIAGTKIVKVKLFTMLYMLTQTTTVMQAKAKKALLRAVCVVSFGLSV